MKKIAFLFLTIDNINFPSIWNKYLKGNEDKYTIYIHPKYPENVIWHKDNIIKNLKVTNKGFITRAYIELLKTAILDKDNFKFITISESCIPIQSFASLYDAITNTQDSWIKLMPMTKYKWDIVLKNITGYKVHHYSRWCLNRDHVKQILVNRDKLEQYHNIQFGDEYILSILHPIINNNNFEITYDNLEYKNSIVSQIKTQIKYLYEEQEKHANTDNSEKIMELKSQIEYEKSTPKQIINVKSELDKIKQCESYFYRKFPKNSNIEKYWEEIIDYHETHKTHLKFKPKKNCIFIHIPKTGGITLFDSTLNLHKSFGWFFGNDKYKNNKDGSITKMNKEGGVSLGHIYYKALLNKNYLSQTFFNNSFKFCFVRNPFSRLISLYKYHKIRVRLGLDFDTFITYLYQEFKNKTIPPVGFYNIKSFNKSSKLYHDQIYGNQYNLMCDWIPNDIGFIGRMETFNNDVTELLKILDYNDKIQFSIPILNSTDRIDYNTYYENKKTTKLVQEIYYNDFIRFGYNFKYEN